MDARTFKKTKEREYGKGSSIKNVDRHVFAHCEVFEYEQHGVIDSARRVVLHRVYVSSRHGSTDTIVKSEWR